MAGMTASRPSSPPPAAPAITEPHDATRRQRADGAEARHRLLYAALRLFAEKGFSKTSTRDIAQAAGVNVASIKYYFADKAGLYRAAFTEPLGGFCERNVLDDARHLTLHEALVLFFTDFLAPLKQSELVQLCIRLHFREMLEPTGIWAEEIDKTIHPSHASLIRVLQQHMGIKRTDDDLHRLAFAISGLALQIYVSRDIIHAIRPALIDSPAQLDRWAAQLADYAQAMVETAIAQRAPAGRQEAASVPSKKKKT